MVMQPNSEGAAPQPQFVQFAYFKADPAWRRLPHSARADVRQVLLYATGLDDQEFIVAYETEDLPRFQSLVIDLRATEARRYTLRDTPIFTAIHRPLREALALMG